MALNKKKFNKRKVVQLSLFLTGFLIIFLTYFISFEKKDESISKLEMESEIIKKDDAIGDDETMVNTFEDVQYKGLDANGNRFVIDADFANFEAETPEIVKMEKIICTFYFKDGTNLKIVSNYGIYNNITNDMEFSDQVKMNYLENVLHSEKANFFNKKNQIMIQGNVKTASPDGNLTADKLDFNLIDKKLKISMYNDEKVNIKVNF
tara:strand:+ start:855 stop:1475 length:621 start_codon:yes stop_codon:yes gene_type:complete